MKKSAIAIILSEDHEKVLLVKRRDVPVWVLPGGGVDEHESPEEAAVREALEETGMEVNIERPVAKYYPINRLAKLTYTFQCYVTGGKLATSEETCESGFFSIHELPRPFFFIHRDWLNDALEQTPGLIEKSLDGITYVNLALYFLKHPIQVFRMLLSRWGLPLNYKGEN